MEIHVHVDDDKGCLTTYVSTAIAVKRKLPEVHTTQLHFLSFDYSDKLFVHTPDGEVHQITLDDCEGTEKCIRKEHNIERLLIAGHFDWFNF